MPADTAILFVHGLLGSPEHFRDFPVPENWTARYITLEGHCGSAKDFSRASMTRWKQQVHEAIVQLRKDHTRIFIVAHSMGTLFALQEAARGKVDGLFLLNAPLKIRVTSGLFKMCWNVYRGTGDDPRTLAAKEAYSIAPDKNLLHYIGWIPRYLELFSQIRETGKQLSSVKAPCYVYLSAGDEMVSPKTRELLQGRKNMTVTILEHSGHFYYAPEDKDLFLGDYQKYILK